MYLETEKWDSVYVITEIRLVYWITTGGYEIFRLDVSIPLELIITNALKKTQHDWTYVLLLRNISG